MGSYCKADDAMVCEECGALVADGYLVPHRRQHPHAFEEYLTDDPECLFCRLPESAPVHAVAPEPGTPAHAHAVQAQAEQERRGFAWLHHCGVLNHGYWESGAMCAGCRFSVDKADHVEEHYRLVPVEGLSNEGQS